MTLNSTLDQLRTLHLNGMVESLNQQLVDPVFLSMGFDQRLGMLVSAEETYRNNKRYQRILKNAKLKVLAMPEDIDYRPGRRLEKAAFADLLACNWVCQHQNLIITGATGTGKTWLACSLAVQAARLGITSAYRRVSRLLDEMTLGHEDGTLLRQRAAIAKVQLLILDDFGLGALTATARSDLLELLDDRVGSASTIVLGQMPVKNWHDYINDPAVADAILDRLVHSSVKLDLKGESMRKVKAAKQK